LNALGLNQQHLVAADKKITISLVNKATVIAVLSNGLANKGCDLVNL